MNAKLTNTVIKATSKVKKYSPQILMGMGIVTGGAGVFFACKQTLKLNDAIKPDVEYLEAISKKAENGYTDDYTEEDAKKETAVCYKNIAKSSIKTYAVPAALLTCSVVSFCSAYKVLNMRNESLALAYGQLLGTFKDYRARVIDKLGATEEAKLYNAVGTKEYINEKGELVREKLLDDDYKALFDEGNPNFMNNPMMNFDFITRVQAMANDIGSARGTLSLNDVRQMLGLKCVDYGQAIGWWWNDEHCSVVDFGLTDDREDVKQFVNGDIKSVWLHFNVDGYIIDKM